MLLNEAVITPKKVSTTASDKESTRTNNEVISKDINNNINNSSRSAPNDLLIGSCFRSVVSSITHHDL
jgi:hypothetical protein